MHLLLELIAELSEPLMDLLWTRTKRIYGKRYAVAALIFVLAISAAIGYGIWRIMQ